MEGFLLLSRQTLQSLHWLWRLHPSGLVPQLRQGTVMQATFASVAP
jgi:hypothetical protein